jgi:hypothetical protein
LVSAADSVQHGFTVTKLDPVMKRMKRMKRNSLDASKDGGREEPYTLLIGM